MKTIIKKLLGIKKEEKKHQPLFASYLEHFNTNSSIGQKQIRYFKTLFIR